MFNVIEDYAGQQNTEIRKDSCAVCRGGGGKGASKAIVDKVNILYFVFDIYLNIK